MWLCHVVLTFFLWSMVHGEYTDPHCNGRQVIVQLFEWKWTDIADECERFLSRKRYCGVQVSPPNEHAIETGNGNCSRSWMERYEPVSYKLISRSGTEEQFKVMVTRCKNVGIRIYVDAEINHMARHDRNGTGSAGSSYDANIYDFPGVPYTREHFNNRSKCPSSDGNVHNFNDPHNIRNCSLNNLTDLDQGQDYVRNKIVEYFDHLIDLGVAGFRISSAQHMWPADLKAIEDRTKNLPEGGRPFFYHDVSQENSAAIKADEYTPLGYVTEFKYLQKIANGTVDFDNLNYLYYGNSNMTMINSGHAFVFIDDHESQRGLTGTGNVVKKPRDYKLATAFTLAFNYGFTRVMSSYYFNNACEGPPHNPDFSTKNVTIYSNETCGGGWVCEHRWNAIANMVFFRNTVKGTNINHWRNQNGEVSFSRGNRGFFVMTKQGHMKTRLQTGLPAGVYCDLITECNRTVTIDNNGKTEIVIHDGEEPIIAIVKNRPFTQSIPHGISTTNIPVTIKESTTLKRQSTTHSSATYTTTASTETITSSVTTPSTTATPTITTSPTTTLPTTKPSTTTTPVTTTTKSTTTTSTPVATTTFAPTTIPTTTAPTTIPTTTTTPVVTTTAVPTTTPTTTTTTPVATTTAVPTTTQTTTTTTPVATTTTVPTTKPTTAATTPVAMTTTVPTTTPKSSWQRTIILIQKFTRDGEDVFILGGIDHDHRSGCTNVAKTSNCSIPIKSHQVGSTGHYVGFHTWQVGDSYLDWYGKEPGQGSYRGKEAEGTPAVWTTNNRNHAGYLDLNTYGDHYWLVDVDMDCSKTENGWFEFKADLNHHMENSNSVQTSSCQGTSEPVPYPSKNHWAKCGSKNIYHFERSSCEIYPLH